MYGNISKLSSFIFKKKIENDITLFYICLNLKILPKMHLRFILIIKDLQKKC
jgi:hypothetical protein